MKQCAACCKELSKDCFSNKQWKLKEYERRCRDCVTNDIPLKKVAPPKPDVPSCWICLDNGEDDSGKPIIRDCSCRGDAGYAHISCLIQYAERKSIRHFEKDELERITEPWNECPNCEQEYRSDLGVQLADGFVTFSRRKFPYKLGEGSLLIPLTFKLRKMKVGCGDNNEDSKALALAGKKVAKEILSIVRKQKAMGESLDFLLCFEKEVYYYLGHYAINPPTVPNAKIALAYYQKSRDIDALFYDGKDWNDNIDDKIVLAKAIIDREELVNTEEKIPVDNIARQKQQYAESVERGDFGDAIHFGMKLVITLKVAREMIYAERVLIEIAALSRRVHGQEHRITKQIEYDLCEMKRRLVILVTEKEVLGLHQCLEYLDNGTKMRVKGPIGTPRDEESEKTFIINTFWPTIAKDGILPLFTPGTPVICHGLDKPFTYEGYPCECDLSHLNGKIGDINRLRDEGISLEHPTIYFEDTNLKPCAVPYSHIRILFDLPAAEEVGLEAIKEGGKNKDGEGKMQLPKPKKKRKDKDKNKKKDDNVSVERESPDAASLATVLGVVLGAGCLFAVYLKLCGVW